MQTCTLTRMSDELAERIRKRLKELNLSAHAASLRADGSPSLIPNILNGRSSNPRADTLAKLAAVLQTTPEWLLTGKEGGSEVLVAPEVPPPATGPTGDRIPILGTAAGALIPTNGDSAQFEGFEIDFDPIGYARLPAGLSGQRSIYAFYVVGDSMDPMHQPGDLKFAQPHRPPAPGDTVVVQTRHWEHDPGQAYIKIFRRRAGGKVILEQINPQVTIQIAEEFIVAMHRVVPNNELFVF